MSQPIYLHNTLSRTKEIFTPIKAPFVGLYVCGPTVYGDPHLGHARSAITFDTLFRLLKYSNYKVRYVRNITDVGHLINDSDDGGDKIGEKARLEELEPMEVAQHYANRYHKFMAYFNMLEPSIEPIASGHIIEQIELTQRIIDKGLAYQSNGSIYFDVVKYDQGHNYGELSGRNLDDTLSGGRSDDYASEKRSPADFALWKKASAEHIMRWNSPWGEGFPGWHAECSAMSAKYLGKEFDIHGGGMDLIFPHHECEISQSTAANGHSPARYWVHNNMITINGQKMGKSLGNSIMLEEFITGNHPLLAQAYSPMTIRFFILQAHYRSTLDFSNEALQAAEKGLERLTKAWQTITKITPTTTSTIEKAPATLLNDAVAAIADDMNTPIAISHLFDWVKVINSLYDGQMKATLEELTELQAIFDTIMGNLLGLETQTATTTSDKLGSVMSLLLEIRSNAKAAKDWTTSDLIRNQLTQAGIQVKDRKDGTADWEII